LLVALVASLALVQAMPQDLFDRFVRDYNRQYASQEEQDYRFGVFTKNLAVIEERNAKDPSARHGINKFSDLTQEEFAYQYLMNN
jgi:cathepsin F